MEFLESECSLHGQDGVPVNVLPWERLIIPVLNPKWTFVSCSCNLALKYYLYLVLVHILHTFGV